MMLMLIHIFLVCMPGYSGINWTQQCYYPAYGLRCKGYCGCKEDLCDKSLGCGHHQQVHFNPLSNHPHPPSHINQTNKQTNKQNEYSLISVKGIQISHILFFFCRRVIHVQIGVIHKNQSK